MRKRKFRIFICIIMLLATLSGCFADLSGADTKTTDDLSFYRVLSGEAEGVDMMPVFGTTEFDIPCPYDLPLLEELEPCKDVRFNYTAKRESLFQSHAYILIVSYDKEQYEDQEAALSAKYTFCTDDSEGFSDGTMSGHTYETDDFIFQAVEGGEYPKEMFLLGLSDTRQEVAVIYFYDQDLDYIDVPLGKFLDNETGWNEIV